MVVFTTWYLLKGSRGTQYNLLKWYDKEWELEKETKVNAEVLSIKSSGIILIFLPAFYLIIWPMTHQRNSEKIPILKM